MKQKHNFTKSQGNFWETIADRKKEIQREKQKRNLETSSIYEIMFQNRQRKYRGRNQRIKKKSQNYRYEFSH